MLQNLGDQLASAINGLLGPVASFLEGYVWNFPPQAPLLAVVLLGTGLFITIRLALIQVRGFKHAIDITRGKYDDPKDAGDLVHFQALTTALSATVGIGNIAGVAIAIRMGGPGALFWMWVTAVFGMALKYAECTLAVAYRKVHPDGSVSGGPMYYIEKGLGPKWRWMAFTFASLAIICSFGTGNMNQANTMADQLRSQFGVPPVISALVFASVVAAVILGGIRRIGRVTSILAPAMAVLYVGGALVILFLHFGDVPAAFAAIVGGAFSPTSVAGGAAGSFLMTLMWGVRRGLFSNEAGQGSAPIAHAAAKTDEPVREGLVASLEPFIDTLVICTMTGLVIVATGTHLEKVDQVLPISSITAVADQPPDTALHRSAAQRTAGADFLLEVREGVPAAGALAYLGATVEAPRILDAGGAPWSGALAVTAADGSLIGAGAARVEGRALLIGAPLTARAFSSGLPGARGDLIVTLSVLLFAVSTAISWSYYGDRATEYVFGSGAIRWYRMVYVCFFFLGCLLPLSTVWTFGDVALGLMSFPNLITLILLSGVVAAMTREYFTGDYRSDRRG
ncbi:MAG TPA: sodium:alanine symporter family protein [Thermoanaerobaculia bacterium]|nr:sodium:alanine symporter family protein [Thermoanaerobaculia bacterium]